MYFKKAAVLGLAVAGAAYAEAAQITKRDGAHGHSHAAAAPAPASGYGAPAASYGAPAPDTGYGAPDTGYGAPDTGYGAPADGYDAPADSYDAAPSYGADGEVGPGILPFVAVILAIIGLSLLFPAVVNIERKKRSVAEESNPVYDLAERVQDMYSAVLRSEECMEKIVCELGGMAKDLTASPVTGLVEPFIPSKYSNYYKQFRSGKDCHKIKC
jgi:hypothetical protein